MNRVKTKELRVNWIKESSADWPRKERWTWLELEPNPSLLPTYFNSFQVLPFTLFIRSWRDKWVKQARDVLKYKSLDLLFIKKIVQRCRPSPLDGSSHSTGSNKVFDDDGIFPSKSNSPIRERKKCKVWSWLTKPVLIVNFLYVGLCWLSLYAPFELGRHRKDDEEVVQRPS